MSEVLGGGFLTKFYARSAGFKRAVFIGLLVFSLVILAVYSLVVFWDGENKLGLITSVSVVIMDVYNYILFKSGMVEKPLGIIFLFIVNRILFVAFGEGYWIYGYMVLYILYATVFGWLIAKKHFPFEGDVVLENAKAAKMKTKKGKALEKYKKIIEKGIDPKWLLLVLTVIFIVLIAVLTFATIDGVNLNSWNLFGMGEIGFKTMAGLSMFFSLSVFLFFCLYRLFVRKAQKMEAYNVKKAQAITISKRYLTPWFFVFLACVVDCVLWACFFWWVSGLMSVLFIGIFGSISALFFTQAYLYFIVNDFDYTQNVEKLNKRIDQHNKNIAEMEIKKAEIQAKIVSGEIFLPPPKPIPPPVDDEPADAPANGETPAAEEQPAAAEDQEMGQPSEPEKS